MCLRYNTFPFWHRCSSADFPSSMTDVGPADTFQELQKENNALKERLEPGSPSWVLRVSKLGDEVTCWNMLNRTKHMLSIVGSPNEQIFDIAEYLSNIPPSGKCLTVPGQKISERACKSHDNTSQLNGWWSGLGNSPFLLGGYGTSMNYYKWMPWLGGRNALTRKMFARYSHFCGSVLAVLFGVFGWNGLTFE